MVSKMRALSISAAAIGLLGLANVAMAAEPLPRPVLPAAPAPAVVVPVYNWAGVYAGIYGGFSWAQVNDLTNDVTIEPQGGQVGLLAGFNVRIHARAILGGEIEFGVGNTTGNDGLGEITDANIDQTIRVRGRLGVVANRALLYVAGGVSWIDLRLTHAPATNPANVLATQNPGWNIGFGVDVPVVQGLVIRGEVLTDRGFNDSVFGFAAHSHTVNIDFVNTARAALIWKF